MHKSSALKAVVVAISFSDVAYAQIPPGFSPSAGVQLLEWYGKNKPRMITPGQTVLFQDTTTTAPRLGLAEPPATSGPYLLTMIDPDAPTPQNPSEAQILHWLQPDMTLSAPAANERALYPFILTSSTDPIAPFYPPMPPPGSAPHRYIQLLWQQPEDFTMPDAFSGFNGQNRTSFDVAAFAAAAGLQGPLAANYWMTSRGYYMTNATSSGMPLPTGSMTIPPVPSPTGIPGTATASAPLTKFAFGACAAVLMFAALI